MSIGEGGRGAGAGGTHDEGRGFADDDGFHDRVGLKELEDVVGGARADGLFGISLDRKVRLKYNKYREQIRASLLTRRRRRLCSCSGFSLRRL